MPLTRTVGALLLSLLLSPSAVRGACTFNMLPGTRYDAGTNAGDIESGFFNADPYVDLAIVNRHSTDARILILLGVGDGSFTPGANIPIEGTWEDLMSGDFNDDGKIDLAVAIRLQFEGETVKGLAACEIVARQWRRHVHLGSIHGPVLHGHEPARCR